MTAIAHTAPFPLWSTDTGISSEAVFLRDAARDTQSITERSQALFGDKGGTIDKLKELVDECSAVGWDGRDGLPISPLTADVASRFIRALSSSLPMPEVSVEPDGEIALEWIVSRSKMFSISIGETSRISYAWLDGGDHGHAVAIFDGKKTPTKIEQGIQGAAAESKAGVRIT